MSKDTLSSLYNGLIKKGYTTREIGDETTFRALMADKQIRRKFYDKVVSRGDFRIGDYDRYEKALSGVYEVQPQRQVQSRQKAKSESVQQDIDVPFSPLAGTVSEESASQVVNGKSLKDIVNGTGDIQVPLKPHGVENGIQGIPVYDITTMPEQYISEAKPYMEEEKRISGEFTPKPVVDASDIYLNYSNRFSLTERGKQLSDELAGITSHVQKKYANEFLASDEFKNLQKQYKGEELDKKANEAFSRLYSGKIDNELQPYVKAYQNEAFSRYGLNIQDELAAYSEKVSRNNKDKIASDVSSLDKSVNAQLEENHRKLSAKAGSGGSAFNALMASASYNAGSAQDRKAKAELEAARQLVDESNNIIEEARKKGKTNFVAGLGRGLSDAVFDANTWSFGLQDMRDASVLVDALDKFDRGETLTESEQTLMDAAVANMAVNAYYYSDLGRGYKAGTVSGQSIPFMLEFAINPVSASGSAIAKNILKYGMKKFGKSAVKNNAAKFAARLVGDAAAAAAMTGTSSAARVAAGAIDRQTGNVKFDFDDKGKLVYAGREGQMGFGEALGKSFASTAIENQSEMVFGAFSGIGSKIWKTIEKYIPGGVAGIMDNAIMGKASDIYHKVFSNPVVTEAMKRAQFHGLIGEYMEEMYSNFAHIPLGEMTLEEATDLDNNIDTFLGLAPTSVAFAAIGLGGLAKEKVQNRKRLNAAINNATEVERKRIEELQQLVKDGGGNEDIKKFIKRIIASNEFTAEQKKNAIRAAFITAQNKAVEEIEDARDKELKENYAAAIEEGSATYMMHKPEEMRQTVLRREVAEQRLLESDFTPEDIQDIKNTPVEERNRILSEFDDADIKKITDFFNAYDREESLNYTLDKVHEPEVDEARSRLKDITLPNNTVTIVPLGQYGTEQAQYGVVVSGIDAQGNPTQSNGAVVTYPVQMVNGTPDFSTIDKDNAIVAIPKSYTDAMVFSPDEAFNGMLTAYQQDAAILEGTPIVPGAQFPVMLDDGSMQNITVAGTAPTGESVVVLPDGKTVNMPADELSMRKRNAEIAPIMAEYAEEEQIRQQAVQEAEVAGYSPETLKSKPFKDEELIINGQKAYVTDYVEGPENLESVTVAFFDGEDSGGTPLRVESITAREYYDYKEAQLEQEKKQQTNQENEPIQQGTAGDNVRSQSDENIVSDRTVSAAEGEATKTTAEQRPQPQQPEADYPRNNKGNPDFLNMQPEQTIQFLKDRLAEDAPSYVRDLLSAAQKAAEKAAKKSPKALDFNERVKENARLKQEREDAAREVEYWQNVSSLMAPEVQPQQTEQPQQVEEKPKPKAQAQPSAPSLMEQAKEVSRKNQERLAAMTEEEIAAAQKKVQENIDKGKYDRKPASRRRSRYNDEDVAMGEAYTPMEHVLREIATGRITFQWSDKGATQGLGSHLGLSGSIKDRQKLFWALHNEEGYPPEVAAEIIHADMPAAMQELVTDQDVFNMILDAFSQYGSPSRMFEAAQKLHGIDIESQPGYEEDMERQELEWHAEHNKMSVDEWTTYLDIVEEEMEKLYNSISDEEINAIFEEIYNDIYYGNRRTENESTGSVEAAGNTETGNEVQPGERTDNETADGRSETESSETNQTDEQGSGVLPEQEIESLNEGSDVSPAQESIRKAEEDVNTNPTEAQKEAGNYKKGHVRIDGMDITIENPKGSTRSGVDANGKQWSVTMNNIYGYIRGTRGVDGDHIDIFLSDNPESGNVYVVDQIRQDTGEFDESKVLYGFNSMEEARQAYLSNYEKDWKVGIITEVTKEEFKKWIDSSWNKVKPFSEYVNVKKLEISDDGNAADINQEPHDILMSIYNSELSKEREKLKDIKKQIAEEQKKEELDNETLERLNEEKDITEHSIKKIKSFTEKKTSVMPEENFLLMEIIKEKSLTYNSGMSINDIMNSVDEDTINDIIDKYPDYIYELSKNGTLQKEFDESGVNDEIIIRNAIESSGYEIDDLINTSEKKNLTKKKRENERNRKSKELMEKLGINSTDIRFRFIGEQGAARLDAAEEATTRLDNLSIAREMEKSGKDAGTVKLATGWERGADGKWRYETIDIEYITDGKARKNEILENKEWYSEFTALSDKLFNGETLTEEEQKRFDKLSDKADELRKQYDNTEKLYLDDYVKDKELFAAYPKFKQTKLLFVDNPEINYSGKADHKGNQIIINLAKADDVKSVLAHEIQHLIQEEEGFARGGNKSTARELYDKFTAWSWRNELTETQKENPDLSQADVEKKLIEEYKETGMENMIPPTEIRTKGFNLFARGYDKEGYEDAWNAVSEGKVPLEINGREYDVYNKLSGEVEARNVQTRLGMTPEQRRLSMASETEDVSREDQIFINNALSSDNTRNDIDNGKGLNEDTEIRFRTSENLITEISDEMQGLIKDTPLSSNPAYNVNNIGTAFYERSGYYMRRLPSPAERKVLKEGNIDIEHAKDVYDKILPVYTELKHELINMIPDATMAARKEIAAYVEAINNNIEYYKGLSEGKDVWRTRPLYRFEDEYGLTEEVARQAVERFEGMVPNHPEIYIAYTEDDLLPLIDKGLSEKRVRRLTDDVFKNPDVSGLFMSDNNIIILFPWKTIDEFELEALMWHENTHYILHNSSNIDYRELKDDCLMYMKEIHPEEYRRIIEEYPKEHWNEEGITFLMQKLVDENGAEKIINAKFEGNDNISRLFTTILNEFKDETKRRGTVRNKLRHVQAEASDGERQESNGNDGGRRSRKPGAEQEVGRKGTDSSELRQSSYETDREGKGTYKETGRENRFDTESGAADQGEYEQTSKGRSPLSETIPEVAGRGENESGRTRQERIKSFITEQANKLNIPVTVYSSLEEVPEGKARKAIEKAEQTGRYPKGWYIPGTDMVYIYLPASTGISDTMATILHEGVAHYGLRKMVGEENLNKFLNDVYSQASPEIRKKILEILNKLNESMPQLQQTLGEATEEYIASLAENGIINPTFWDKVKQLFKKMLESIGYRWKITDSDIRYILWESKNNLRKSRKPLDVAKETVMRNKLGIGEFGVTPTSGNARFRLEDRPDIVEEYDEAVSTGTFNFLEAWQDSMRSLKELMRIIVEHSNNKEVRDFENAYDAENHLSSINKQDNWRYIKKFYAPMVDHIDNLSRKYGRKLVEDYIYAKSGLERNDNFLLRDAEETKNRKLSELDAKIKSMEEELIAGMKDEIQKTRLVRETRLKERLKSKLITAEKYEKQLEKIKDYIDTRYEEELEKIEGKTARLYDEEKRGIDKEYNDTISKGRDYSGLEDLVWLEHKEELDVKKENGEISEEEYEEEEEKIRSKYKEHAEGIVDKFETTASSEEVNELWKLINAATHENLRKEFECGMITREHYDKLSNMMKYYVPMREWEETVAEEIYNYETKKKKCQ